VEGKRAQDHQLECFAVPPSANGTGRAHHVQIGVTTRAWSRAGCGAMQQNTVCVCDGVAHEISDPLGGQDSRVACRRRWTPASGDHRQACGVGVSDERRCDV